MHRVIVEQNARNDVFGRQSRLCLPGSATANRGLARDLLKDLQLPLQRTFFQAYSGLHPHIHCQEKSPEIALPGSLLIS